MTALELKQPGIIFRGAILFAQGTVYLLHRIQAEKDYCINRFSFFSIRCFCKPLFPGLPDQSQVLPQICGIFRGRGGEDIYPLFRGIAQHSEQPFSLRLRIIVVCNHNCHCFELRSSAHRKVSRYTRSQ